MLKRLKRTLWGVLCKAPSCGFMLRVHPVLECAWCKPAGHVVYLTQNRTPLMFERMEPPEGGGTDDQGGQGGQEGQGVNGLPITQPDNINSMWVEPEEGGRGGSAASMTLWVFTLSLSEMEKMLGLQTSDSFLNYSDVSVQYPFFFLLKIWISSFLVICVSYIYICVCDPCDPDLQRAAWLRASPGWRPKPRKCSRRRGTGAQTDRTPTTFTTTVTTRRYDQGFWLRLLTRVVTHDFDLERVRSAVWKLLRRHLWLLTAFRRCCLLFSPVITQGLVFVQTSVHYFTFWQSQRGFFFKLC